MKKLIALLLAMFMVLGLVACGKTDAPAADAPAADAPAADAPAADAPAADGAYDLTGCDPIQIVLPLPNGVTSVDTVYTEKWMALVTERSEGLITFDYSNSGALGAGLELLEGVDMGAYDISVVDLAGYNAYVPQVDALCLPYIIKDWDHAIAVHQGEIADRVSELVSNTMNLTLLGNIGMGFRTVISKDPLTSLADCKDYLIRTPDMALYHDALGTLGFSCTSLAFGETYSGIEAGIINGMETTLNVLYDNGFYEVAKNILQTRHFFACSYVCVNTDFWNGLPEVYRQIIADSFKEIEAEAWAFARTTEEEMVPKFEAEGVTIYEFSAEDQEKLVELFSDYWYEKAGNMGDGASDLIDEVVALQ